VGVRPKYSWDPFTLGVRNGATTSGDGCHDRPVLAAPGRLARDAVRLRGPCCAAWALLDWFLSWPHAWGWAVYGRRPYGIIVQSCNAGRGGTIFGYGNQQLSPQVIQAVGRDSILVIATRDKLHALDGPPRVDTGDPSGDRFLAGYVRVITGERERAMWQVAA